MHPPFETGLVWFRRDLRVQDNTALTAALRQCQRVHCVFVFDRAILDALPRLDRRVAFIHASLTELDGALRELAGSAQAGLMVLHDSATKAIPALAQELGVQAVFAAGDYEPQAQLRDQAVERDLQDRGIAWCAVKDHVVFERREILTQSAKAYTVFTPYLRTWLSSLEASVAPGSTAATQNQHSLAQRPPHYSRPVPSLESLGFAAATPPIAGIPAGSSGGEKLFADFWERMDTYDQTRNYPCVKGPSYLGVHLRFGTLSIRHLVSVAFQRHLQGSKGATVWLGELAWRDFYFQILANFPRVVGHAFKPEYDQIVWESGTRGDALFLAWTEGRTGYPLVDAAMAQLNQTGYMHNRLRMVAGSFLVKHLGIDWRRGEAYFAEKLNDFDLAANNGGWQWVSSSGCDAQPYFRIFNPVTQSQKFDAQGKFIRRYLPQLAVLDAKNIHAPWLAKPVDLAAAGVILGHDYPLPIVDHAQARAATLERYAAVKKVS